MKNHIFLTCLIKSIQFHNAHARNSAFSKSNTLTHNFENNYDGQLTLEVGVKILMKHDFGFSDGVSNMFTSREQFIHSVQNLRKNNCLKIGVKAVWSFS